MVEPMQPSCGDAEEGGKRIIVIDDDDFTRSVIVRQLNALDLENVHSVHDWQHAATLLRNNPACDLVVTDLDMPGVKGSNFLKELAETSPNVSVILVSALAPVVLRSAEKQARRLSLRVLGSISKPTSVEAFRTLLAAHPELQLLPSLGPVTH